MLRVARNFATHKRTSDLFFDKFKAENKMVTHVKHLKNP